MTEDRGGFDAPRSPQRRQRDLQREDGRLPETGAAQLRALLVGAELLQQRPAGKRTEQVAHLLDGAAEDRLFGKQLAPHRPPLLPHPRAYEDRCRRRAGDAAGRAIGAFLSPQVRLELLDQLGLVVRDQCQAELVVRSLHVCRKTDVAQGFAASGAPPCRAPSDMTVRDRAAQARCAPRAAASTPGRQSAGRRARRGRSRAPLPGSHVRWCRRNRRNSRPPAAAAP